MNFLKMFAKATAMFAAGMVVAEVAGAFLSKTGVASFVKYLKYPIGGGAALGVGKLLKVF